MRPRLKCRWLLRSASLLAFGVHALPGTAQVRSADSLHSVSPFMAKFIPPAPTPKSHVLDVPHILTAAAHDSIDAIISNARRDTHGEIAVAILQSVGDFNPYDVAIATLRSWRIGKVDTVSGKMPKGSPVVTRTMGTVLLIVPKETAPDRKGRCWLASGDGMASVLSDTTGSDICGKVIIPHLKVMDYPGGVRAGVEAIVDRYRDDAARRNRQPKL